MVTEGLALINRFSAGGAAWIATGLLLPLQAIVALKWPRGYSLTKNAISDLGITTCGPVSGDGNAPVRDVCSPWHVAFNGGLIASGALMAVGSVLLYGWWTGRAGRAGTVLMAFAGASVVAVGLVPWNLNPALHDAAAIGQALVQWLAMVLLAKAAGPGRFQRLTVATVAVSVAGFIAFIAAIEGTRVPLLTLGIAERLSFDALTLWTAVAGTTVLARKGKRVRAVARRNGEREAPSLR